MADFFQTPRFQLPDDWQPEGTVCVRVTIPDDQQYMGQLIGFLDNLKWSRNFEPDDTKTGAATVSRTWQAALESQPIVLGECYMAMLRQNPDNPCRLEQSLDNGETWILAFDYSLCVAVITVPAPYPGSETGASDAAAASMHNIFEALTNMVDCEASRESYIAAATAYLRTFDAGYANPAALGAIYDAFCALDEGEQDFWKSDCPFEEHKDDIEACADASGLYDWLNCGAETINDWLNETGEDIMNALNAAAAALSPNGWQNTAAGGAGGGASFGSECVWSHTFDFTVSDWDFTVEIPPLESVPLGTYDGANGWKVEQSPTISSSYKLFINTPLPLTGHVTHVQAICSFTTGSNDVIIYEAPDDTYIAEALNTPVPSYPDPVTIDFDIDETMSQFTIYVRQGISEADGWLRELTLSGTGTNPFA